MTSTRGTTAKHLELGQQERAATMQPRANRADWASKHLCRFLVAQLFEFAQHHGFAELRRQIRYSGADLRGAFLLLGPVRWRKGADGRGIRAGAVGIFFLKRNLAREAIEMLHHPVARDAEQV